MTSINIRLTDSQLYALRLANEHRLYKQVFMGYRWWAKDSTRAVGVKARQPHWRSCDVLVRKDLIRESGKDDWSIKFLPTELGQQLLAELDSKR